METVVTNQNCINEEIKNKFNLGSACYRSVVFPSPLYKRKD